MSYSVMVCYSGWVGWYYQAEGEGECDEEEESDEGGGLHIFEW
jgi:hypothetical protein